MKETALLVRELMQVISDEVDQKVVKDILSKMDIEFTSLHVINDLIASQIELEAGIIYLVDRYSKKLDECKLYLDQAEATLQLGMPAEYNGKKVTKDIATAVMNANIGYSDAKTECYKMETLCKTLQVLQRSIFSRDRKLEIVSNNYRKEMQFDESN